MTAGSLRLDLCGAPLIETAALHSQRPVTAARVLVGKPVEQALTLVPLLFSLCGRAQSYAAQAAVAAARGERLAPPVEAAARLMVAAEMLQELLYPPLISWRPLAGLAADAATMAAALAVTRAAMAAAKGGEAVDAPSLRATIEPVLPARDEPLLAWAEGSASPLAELWRVLASGPRGSVQAPRFLPRLNAQDLAARWPREPLADQAFCAAPLWDGAPAEAGPLALYASHPQVQAVSQRYGYGPLARLAARLLMARQALEAICGDQPAPEASAHCVAEQLGLAVVLAARGPLAHRVQLDPAGRVRAWSILAPTEWSFHPDSPWLSALCGQAPKDAERAATWLAASLDPCVPYQVVVVDRPA